MTLRALLRSAILIVAATNAEAQSIQAPTYAVGDQWTNSAGRTIHVVALESDHLVINGLADWCWHCTVHADKNGVPLRVFGPGGKEIADPDQRANYIGAEWRWFDWPLSDGKAWSIQGRIFFNNRARKIRVAIYVIGSEVIATRAGTFQGIKLRQEFRAREEPANLGGSWTRTVWYAPSVKAIVKSATSLEDEARWFNWDLVSYNVK